MKSLDVSQTAFEWFKQELSVEVWLSCTLTQWLGFTIHGINYSRFLFCACLPPKCPAARKISSTRNAQTFILTFYDTDILSNDFFYFPLNTNLRL